MPEHSTFPGRIGAASLAPASGFLGAELSAACTAASDPLSTSAIIDGAADETSRTASPSSTPIFSAPSSIKVTSFIVAPLHLSKFKRRSGQTPLYAAPPGLRRAGRKRKARRRDRKPSRCSESE